MHIGLNGRYLGTNKTGVGRYLLSLLQEWRRNPQGHTFTVYVSDEVLTPEDQDLFRGQSPIRLRRIPRPLHTRSYHAWYNWTLPRAMLQDHVDWFFSPDYFSPLYLPPKIRRSQVLHDVSFLAHPNWFSLPFQVYCQIWSKRPATTADLLFAVSEYSKFEIQKYISVPEKKIIVAHGAAEPKFQPASIPSKIELYGLHGPFFLYVGKILNRRHVPQLLEAFMRVAQEHAEVPVQLLIRGANETHPYINIEERIRSINSTLGREAIVYPKYISDSNLIGLYQSALGFCYLSTYEGFGLPILESLSCGTPVITVNATSIPEVAGDAGLYVDPTSVDQIAEQLRLLLTNESFRHERKVMSLKQSKNFSWGNTAIKILDELAASYGT